MALLQALLSFIGKSAGKILDAILGWAVVALFGRVSPRQKMLLSGLVIAAAAWPVLVLGIAFPKITALVFAFVPLSDRVPSWMVRLVWLGLALAVPVVIGTVIAAKAPPGSPRESFVTRLLRGFPITLGIAGAFLLMFISVPILRVASAAKGRKDEHVPCITDGEGYETVAAQIDAVLRGHGLEATRTEPSWWLSGPSKLLQKLGGKALRGFVPDRLAYWKGPDLEVAFYPSDILIRGKNTQTAWTHGLLAEQLAHGPSRQTFDAQAQDLERQIHQVWSVYDENPVAHTGSRSLLSRLKDIAKELGRLKVEYDQWQVVYRQTLQLDRALHGQQQILQSVASSTEDKMQGEPGKESVHIERPLASASTGELLGQLAHESGALMKKEIELAKAELRADIKREIKMAEGLGVAGICALATLNLLLVAVVLALAQEFLGWASALIVAAVVLAIGAVAGLVGWAKRVKKPLEKTEKTLKEDARWAKERLT
jgi:uncharacterized membrane protein YqjE